MDTSASSSSFRRPRPTAFPTAFRPMSTHSKRNSGRSSLFLSRLPADPFSSAHLQRDPIILNSERLYNAAFNSHPTRDVILVLGGQLVSYPSPPRSLPHFSTYLQTQVQRTCPLYSSRSALHSPFSSLHLIGLQPYPQRYSLRFEFFVWQSPSPWSRQAPCVS